MLFDQDTYTFELEELLEKLSDELSKIRTGKPNIKALQEISVESYGEKMNLNAVGKIIVDGPMSVKVEIWDKNNTQSVFEALEKADLGVKLSQEGNMIRMNFISLTEEDRKEKADRILPKLLNSFLTAAREQRRKYNDKVKSLEKVSEDEQERSYETIQGILKEYEAKMELAVKTKREDLTKTN